MLATLWFPFVISLVSGYMFMSLAPLTDQFMALFGVGYAGLSIFLSGLLWAQVFVMIPAGLILDRLGVYRGFLISVAIALLSNLLPFIAPHHLEWATFLRFCAGISAGLMFLTGLKVAGMVAPAGKMAQAQGIQGAAFSLGTMLPYVTLPYLGSGAWRFSYWIPAVLTLLLFAASIRLPGSIRQQEQGSRSATRDLWQALASIFASRPLWTIGIFHGFSYGTLNNLGQWLPSILRDMDGQAEMAAWSMGTALVILVGTLARAFASSLLRWYSRSFITNSAVLFIALLYIVLGLTANPWAGLAVSMVLAWLGGANYGSVFSLAGRSVSPAFMATASGVVSLIANLTNVLLTLFLGMVREYAGDFSLALCATGLIALGIWIAGYRTIRQMDNPA